MRFREASRKCPLLWFASGDPNPKSDLTDIQIIQIPFSTAMRILHNTSAVSGEHNEASKYLQLRERTRRNALVYAESLLPKVDELIKKIKGYAFEIRVSTFEEWRDGLEDIVAEVTKAEKSCNQLMNIHENLIDELKKNEEDALVSIKRLEELTKVYEKDRNTLLKFTEKQLRETEQIEDPMIAKAITNLDQHNTKATMDQEEINRHLLKATAHRRNGEISKEAINLTEKYLIPAIKNFLSNLGVCKTFLSTTTIHLSQLVKSGSNSSKKRYFEMMKMHVEKLEENCKTFIASSVHMKTDLKSISSEPSDKNHVDNWLSDQLAAFDKSDSSQKGNQLMLHASPNGSSSQLSSLTTEAINVVIS